MRWRWLTGSIVVWVIASILAGCSVNSSSSTNPMKQSDVHATGRVLTIGTTADIESFDPHNNANTVSEAVLVNMFDYLLKNDNNQHKIPVLATSWKQTDDNTWRFNLRRGVHFHNGDLFTAADVKYTLERVAKDTSLKQNSYFKNIAEVRVIDDYTVDIVTDGPDPLLLNRLCKTGAGMLPSKYIDTNGIAAFLNQPVGTGPYKFGKWMKNDRVELIRNDDFFGGKPKWDEVVFRALPESASRVSALLAGDIDIATGLLATDSKRINEAKGKTIVKAPIQRVLQIILRMSEGSPTADPKVREAIDLAINKQSLVNSIAGGAGIVTRTSVTPGNFGADLSLYKQALYNPSKAKQLLQAAGYSTSGPEIHLSASSTYKEYASRISAMLDQVGFKTKLDVLEPGAFMERYDSKTFKEAFMIGIGNSLFDASNNFNRYLKSAAVGETDYNNPKTERLLQAAATNTDITVREKQYQEVQQILAVDRPAVYLFQMEGIYGMDQRVRFEPRKDEMFYAEDIVPVS